MRATADKEQTQARPNNAKGVIIGFLHLHLHLHLHRRLHLHLHLCLNIKCFRAATKAAAEKKHAQVQARNTKGVAMGFNSAKTLGERKFIIAHSTEVMTRA